jgi:FkbM family methyltransferase
MSIKDKVKRSIATRMLGYSDARPSFSHCGEDRVLAYLFKRLKSGFFVDVGAFHPQNSSNTFLLYHSGWRGINIDARPGSMDAFKRMRPEDINLELAISEREETLTYYQIGEGSHEMNSFSLAFQSNLYEDYGIRDSDVRKIPMLAKPLRSVLDQHLPRDRAIDLLTIDVEGLELQVLSSNDWARYRPMVIMIEHHQEMAPSLYDLPACAFLAARSYRLVCKLPNELVFLRGDIRLNKSGMIEPKS